jgi:hypothetical protein
LFLPHIFKEKVTIFIFILKGENEYFLITLHQIYTVPHCKKNSIYVFLFWELCSLSLNFHIHVYVSDLYIPRIGPHISLQQNRQTYPGKIKISHRYMSVGTGR